MLETKEPHLDDFTLLRYVAFDLDEIERRKVSGHVETCPICQATLGEIEELNRELADLAKDPTVQREWETEDLPENDHFRQVPQVQEGHLRRQGTPAEFAVYAVASSEKGAALATSILDAAKSSAQDLETELSRLELSNSAHRFALLYALQNGGVAIAESPGRFLGFAEQALARLRSSPAIPSTNDLVPDAAIFGQAQQLAGQACLWTGDLERAGSCFSLAYRFYGQLGDELALAKVEQLESQRRFFAGKGNEALVLARRAVRRTDLLEVEDEQARARVAEGMALFALSRWNESLEAFRRALPIFERFSLWSNYVGTLNCIGNALVKLNRLDEARREYAKALRRISREQHRSWLPFIRKGLAEILFSAQRYREAAVAASQAARLYEASGQVSRFLMACLFEAESWARAGDPSRARHRLELFQSEIARRGALDATVNGLIVAALSGRSPDFEKIAELRALADTTFEARFRAMPA